MEGSKGSGRRLQQVLRLEGGLRQCQRADRTDAANVVECVLLRHQRRRHMLLRQRIRMLVLLVMLVMLVLLLLQCGHAVEQLGMVARIGWLA